MLRIGLVCSLASSVLFCSAQLLPYQDTALPPSERVSDLVGRLTLEEKAQLMCDVSEAIPRLGIKKFCWWSEALHGVGNVYGVTVFPEPIGMAASFNDRLLHDVFTATSDEARAQYNELVRKGEDVYNMNCLSFWTPNVNIFRDPRWGRGQETYGEDPYLTERMGVAVVRGLQGEGPHLKLLACAKHFAVHSGPEWARHVDNITDVDPRDMWETYMPAFKALVQKADVREVMCAYQRLDNEPCCGNSRLLQQILRDEWGYKYMVVSDCGAIADFHSNHRTSPDAAHAAADGVMAGTDVECGWGYAYKELPKAVEQGLIDESEIDRHVARVLEARISLGEMDDPEQVEWSKIPASVINCDRHRQLALDMARQSIVLLQNRADALPLAKGGQKIAVVGPNAHNARMQWGNYNGTPRATTTILDGIRQKVGADNVRYMAGCDHVTDKLLVSYLGQCAIDGRQGIKGTFWNNELREGDAVQTIYTDQPINVSTTGQHPFAPGVNLEGFSAKYETVFRPAQSGRVALHLDGCSVFELLVNGQSMRCEDTWQTCKTHTYIDVVAGEEYRIEVRYRNRRYCAANLRFDIGREDAIDYTDSIASLHDIETVVFVGGISPQLEGEEMPVDLPGFKGGDRTEIELPEVQRRFLRALKEAGKRVIFVNCSGSAVAMQPETVTCDAIVQAWYGGELGGEAVADVLFGDYNPQGKLPITFYRSLAQVPDYRSYSMRARTYRYMDDEPLWAFGHGLSYTSFAVGRAKASRSKVKAGQGIDVTVPVSNVGGREGTEVIQLYLRRNDDTDGPVKALRGFERIALKAGEKGKVVIHLSADQLETFDPTTNTMRVVPGSHTLYYGTSSADKDLQQLSITIK